MRLPPQWIGDQLYVPAKSKLPGLVLAALRGLQERHGRAPRIKEIAAEIGRPSDLGRVGATLSALRDAGKIRLIYVISED